MQIDKETQIEMKKAENASKLVNSGEWIQVRERLYEIIKESTSVLDIPPELKSSDDIAFWVKSNAKAAEILRGWIQEVEQLSIKSEALQEADSDSESILRV